MSSASAQSDARVAGQNRDTISGGTMPPWMIAVLVVAVIAVAWILRGGRR